MPRARVAVAVLLATIPLLAVVAVLPPLGFFAGDSGAKLLQAQAIAERDGWPRPIPYPASGVDPEGSCLPRSLHASGGGAVAMFPVVFPVLLSPFVSLGNGQWLLLLPLLGGIASAWLAGHLARPLGMAPRAGAVAVACLLATPLAFYSVVLWEHSLATALIVGALLIAVSHVGRGTHTPWGLFGLLVGLAPWLRSELLVMLPLLLAPAVVADRLERFRAVIRAAGGGAVGLLAGTVVQKVTLGMWLPVHLVHHAELDVLKLPFMATRRASLITFFAPDWWVGAAALSWLVALVLVVATRHRGVRLVRLLAVVAMVLVCWAALGMPALRYLQGVRPATAFSVRAATTAWIILGALPLALTGVPQSGSVRRRRLLLALVAGWLVVACLLALPVDGGYQWGARFFLPAVVLLTVLMLTAPTAQGRWERSRRLLVGAAVAAGVGVQIFGMALLVHVSRGNVALRTAVEDVTQAGELVVCDTHFIPELAAPIWKQRRFLWCPSREASSALLERLASAGVGRWALAYVDEERDHSLEPDERLIGRGGAVWVRDGSLATPIPGRTLHVIWYDRAPTDR